MQYTVRVVIDIPEMVGETMEDVIRLAEAFLDAGSFRHLIGPCSEVIITANPSNASWQLCKDGNVVAIPATAKKPVELKEGQIVFINGMEAVILDPYQVVISNCIHHGYIVSHNPMFKFSTVKPEKK